MIVNDLFERSVLRPINPVVYFHDQSPDKLAEEVGEYIITGGWPKDHPNSKRVPLGIHEQYVKLLKGIRSELNKPGGPDQPASWISGFYGSGKSSFAKLLGLALGGTALPDGTPLSQALLLRDTAPRRQELVDAWTALQDKVDGLAVVFDVGGRARGSEHIHAVVVRQVQSALHYASNEIVANYELDLERDGQYANFEAKALEVLGVPWEERKHTRLVHNHFSQVMHALFPEQFHSPTAWYIAHSGHTAQGLSASEATRAIGDMLDQRAPGKTLFIVVDEVSQYIHQDTDRMLKLQSFVSDLGQRLRGRAWLLVTGQEKLDDAGGSVLGKMKDRFPDHLRVHLAANNIRDVVHKRLLLKSDEGRVPLRELYQKHRHDLTLFAYEGDKVSEEDFVELYPLLPGYINLVLRVTSAVRARSDRAQGDDQAIRGLLQMLVQLFTTGFANREIGALVCLEDIFDLQQSALHSDTQQTFARLRNFLADHEDRALADRALRAAKAVALLEQIQDQEATTAEFVAKALFSHVSSGSQVAELREGLELLRRENLLGYSEKHGYKIQSTAGEAWEKTRNDLSITKDEVNEHVRQRLDLMMGSVDRPNLQGRAFPWAAWFHDGRGHEDSPLKRQSDAACAMVDLHFVPNGQQDATSWVHDSASRKRADRIQWVVGPQDHVDDVARRYGRARKMVARYQPRRASLTRDQQMLLLQEEANADDLETLLGRELEKAFLDGAIYLRGEPLEPHQQGATFREVLTKVGQRFLPTVYPHFVPTQIQPSEQAQLLKEALMGLSPRFMQGELGLFELDAGSYVATCNGVVPVMVAAYIDEGSGVSGQMLLDHFGGPPYGFASSVTRAVLAALLRAGRVRIKPEQGEILTSVRDVGATDLFTKDGPLRRADVLPAGQDVVGRRSRTKICKLFKAAFNDDPQRDNDAIANAIVKHFPITHKQLAVVTSRYAAMGTNTPLPAALIKLKIALDDVLPKARLTEEAVLACARHLDAISDGLSLLAIVHAELTAEASHAVYALSVQRLKLVPQLDKVGAIDDALAGQIAALNTALSAERPWQHLAPAQAAADAIAEAYTHKRLSIIQHQEAEANEARVRVKSRGGFSRLTGDQSHHVLRPIHEACDDPTLTLTEPSLHSMVAIFPSTLRQAEDEAVRLFDEILSAKDKMQVMNVDLSLRHREVTTKADVDALCEEIREVLSEAIGPNRKVRIVMK